MKTAALLLLALASVATASPSAASVRFLPAGTSRQCDPETTTTCSGGCCPYVDWVCCDDGRYCAETEAECPPWVGSISSLDVEDGFGVRQAECSDSCPSDWQCCPSGVCINCPDDQDCCI